MRVDDKTCPWCGRVAGYRDLTSAESSRLERRIFWQSLVLSAADAVRHPIGYVPALVGAKGRERRCRGCEELVRICPKCDKVHRWLNAGLLTCECGAAFL